MSSPDADRLSHPLRAEQGAVGVSAVAVGARVLARCLAGFVSDERLAPCSKKGVLDRFARGPGRRGKTAEEHGGDREGERMNMVVPGGTERVVRQFSSVTMHPGKCATRPGSAL